MTRRLPFQLLLHLFLTLLLYTHMHAENNDTIITTSQYFRKIYLSLYLKGLCVRRSWRPNRTTTHWPPLLWPSAFLSYSPGLLNRGPGAQPLWGQVFSTASYHQLVWSPNWLIGGLRAPSAGCWLSLPHLVSKLSEFPVQHPLNISPLLAIGICTSAVFGMACLIVIERK